MAHDKGFALYPVLGLIILSCLCCLILLLSNALATDDLGILEKLTLVFAYVDVALDIKLLVDIYHVGDTRLFTAGAVCIVVSAVANLVFVLYCLAHSTDWYSTEGARTLYAAVCIISLTKPDAMVLFPWKNRSKMGFPNARLVAGTLVSVVEDIPQICISIIYLFLYDFDYWAAMSLITSILHILMGICVRCILLAEEQEEQEEEHQEEEQHKVQV